MSLKELRLKRGLTQEQLAEKAKLTRSRIADYETGYKDINKMELATAIRLGDALKVSNLRKLLDNPQD